MTANAFAMGVQLAAQTSKQILLNRQAADVQHAGLGAGDYQFVLVGLGDDASHDRGVGGVVAQQPEPQGIPYRVWKGRRVLPERGKDD